MLKIKDNINMKILEQYGFSKHEYIGDIDIEEWFDDHWIDEYGNKVEAPPLDREKVDRTCYKKKKKNDRGITKYSNINVFANKDEKRREIFDDDFDIDILYELIKADLVERV